MLNFIKEPAFFERTAYWKDYGYGTMLVYIEPPKKENRTKWKCEYVAFRIEGTYKRTVINEYLLDVYNQGE